MKISIASFILLVLFKGLAGAQPMLPVDREFRAVWIATVDNIDFPTKKTLSIEEQKAELIGGLDLARRLRLNAVIFQVRPMCDAIYRSDIEPWSEFLTGEMGKSQAFDPLEFVVAEAHKRGILVHAWFNPYRAYHPAAKTISPNHISKRRPDLVRSFGKYMWLDPTDDEVKSYSLNVVSDVVRRYDIDGVQFDDYFYPYPEMDTAGNRIEFPDDKNWEAYKAGGGTLNRGDWRRWHVDRFVESVGREIKRVKPRVVFGISPFGIWKPDPAKGITGFNQFAELYADARKWFRDGTVDYLSPQLYWETARKGQSFPVLLDWWNGENVMGRHLWPGLASYRIGSTATFTASEVAEQIGDIRRLKSSAGAIHFSFKSLRNDLGGIQEVLRDSVYIRDAVIPAFPWISSAAPPKPRIRISRIGKYVRVRWTAPGTPKAFWFVVFVKDKDGWSYSVLPASESSATFTADRHIEKIVIKGVDRLGNESR